MFATPSERRMIALLLSLLVGIVGLGFLFSDLGPAATLPGRFAAALILAGAFGGWAGFFVPRGWLLPAVLSCWGDAVIGVSTVAAGGPPPLAWAAVFPLAFAVGSGYFRAWLGPRRQARLRP